MGEYSEVFVAFDVAKKKHAVAIAEGGRQGEVRFLGDVENSPLPIEKTIKRLATRYDQLHVCFEAGPTGYGLYRQVKALGHDCMVVAPALIPKRAGERIKTNRRDAVTLARLHRAGELTGVWAPDPAHEAVRDLVRARESAADDLRRKRQQLLSFLLRHSRIYSGGGTGRWRIGAGSPVRSSITLRSRSSFRKGSMRAKILCSACAVSRSNSPSSCRNGPWRRSWKLTRPCAARRFSSP
jgi:transposase